MAKFSKTLAIPAPSLFPIVDSFVQFILSYKSKLKPQFFNVSTMKIESTIFDFHGKIK